jgi:hypothetical protein
MVFKNLDNITKTAIPFKSEPQLAAVADVFGTLSVDVSAIWMKSAEISRALLATCKKSIFMPTDII